MWQDRYVRHTCSTSHDRLKDTPKFDLNSLRNLAYVGDEEIFFSGNDEIEESEDIFQDLFGDDGRGNPIVETSDDEEPLPPLDLDPSLFEEIVIKPKPFKSRCK